jgi:hypothetical protein
MYLNIDAMSDAFFEQSLPTIVDEMIANLDNANDENRKA